MTLTQGALRSFGYTPGAIDGLMTFETGSALRAFQRKQGLRVTGRANPEARASRARDRGQAVQASAMSSTTGTPRVEYYVREARNRETMRTFAPDIAEDGLARARFSRTLSGLALQCLTLGVWPGVTAGPAEIVGAPVRLSRQPSAWFG